jgi:hypothetical protein
MDTYRVERENTMARKSLTALQAANDAAKGWVRSHEWVAPTGRRVAVGTELSITRERGRFRFQEHVVTPTNEWLVVVGGPGRGEHQTRQFRFFTPDRVKTVHIKQTIMTPEEARLLVNEKAKIKRSAV